MYAARKFESKPIVVEQGFTTGTCDASSLTSAKAYLAGECITIGTISRMWSISATGIVDQFIYLTKSCSGSPSFVRYDAADMLSTNCIDKTNYVIDNVDRKLAEVYRVTTYFSDDACTKPTSMYMVRENAGDLCAVKTNCARDIFGYYTVRCDASYTAAAADTFGLTPYVVQEDYQSSNCKNLKSAVAYRADGMEIQVIATTAAGTQIYVAGGSASTFLLGTDQYTSSGYTANPIKVSPAPLSLLDGRCIDQSKVWAYNAPTLPATTNEEPSDGATDDGSSNEEPSDGSTTTAPITDAPTVQTSNETSDSIIRRVADIVALIIAAIALQL